jgi:predicted nucleic acid-binding protein
MARRTESYIDTSAFIAFLDRSDSYQSPFKRLFSDPPALVTSALVIAEELSIRVDGFDGLELEKAKTFVKKFAGQ